MVGSTMRWLSLIPCRWAVRYSDDPCYLYPTVRAGGRAGCGLARARADARERRSSNSKRGRGESIGGSGGGGGGGGE